MIKWKSHIFSHLNNFDVLTFNDVLNLYKKQYNFLIENGYEKYEEDKLDPFAVFLTKQNSFQFNPIRLKKNNEQTNITLDFNGKSYKKDFYENGHFMYYEVPNYILVKMTSHLWQPSLSIIDKFLEEVNWDEDWKSLMNDYDEKYPDKHITNKKEGEYSWRANFSPEWFNSFRLEGVISPIVLNVDEVLFNRGSHRGFMCGRLGYDLPIFIPNISENISLLTNNHFDGKSLELEISNNKDMWYSKLRS